MDTRTTTNTLLSIILFFAFLFVPAVSWGQVEVAEESSTPLATGVSKAERISGLIDPFFDDISKNLYLDQDVLLIDLSKIDVAIAELFESDFSYSWSIEGLETPVTGPVLNTTFSTLGQKVITLSVQEETTLEDGTAQSEIVYSKTFEIFVYSKSLAIIDLRGGMQGFIEDADSQGILLYDLIPDFTGDFQQVNILAYLKNYRNTISGDISDYIVIFANRQDSFSAISRMNQEFQENPAEYTELSGLHVVVVTQENPNKFVKLYENFLSSKNWLSEFVIVENAASRILFEMPVFSDLVQAFTERDYDSRQIDTSTYNIPKYLFVSRFVSQLSAGGFTTQDILILLSIPFILTMVVVFKHFIGIGSIGILLPVFLTIMVVREGIFPSLILYILFFMFNVGMSVVFSRYNMLYIPRIAFVVVCNILVYIFVLTFLIGDGVVTLNPQDVVYMIVFIFLLERSISLVWSKEFREYVFSLVNTLVFILICGFLFSLSLVQTFILSYPESIILLIAVNLFLGRYKGLRVTEYFRFWEVIGKNQEEEEE